MCLLYLFLLRICCYSVGGYSTDSFGANKEACFGDDFSMPLSDLGYHQNVFFTPKRGSEKQVLWANGTSLEPHYEITTTRFIIRKVTERDEGEFSYRMYGLTFKALGLKIKDCSNKVRKDYGSDSYFRVQDAAYSLEFTPPERANDPPVLLWNRTGNPRASEGGGRGRLVNNEWRMEKLTQEFNGYYTFRDKKHKFISRNKMTVEAQKRFLDGVEGQDLQIINFRMRTMDPDGFDLTFNPTDDPEPVLLMKAGDLLTDYTEWESEEGMFAGRIQKIDVPTLQIIIEDLRPSDSGQFKLIDQKGNPALIVELNVEKKELPNFVYVGFAVAILFVLVCSRCCVKKWCKKTTRKNARQTEAAPAAYYYDDTTQPSTSAHPSSSYGPTYSAPVCPKEPASTYHQPLVSGPENLHVSSSQPQVVASTASHEPASTAFLGVDTLSSDAGPQFELKGMLFPSAPPLSSHTSFSDVYTSDKLNFL